MNGKSKYEKLFRGRDPKEFEFEEIIDDRWSYCGDVDANGFIPFQGVPGR
jgi:hypothetical protein